MRQIFCSQRVIVALFVIIPIVMFVSGCKRISKDNGSDDYNPGINPANFVREITNPFFPLTPGTLFNYRGKTVEGTEIDHVYVTYETKEILGVTCVVVADSVWFEGDLREATFDWYAQDREGNVWYFGEDSRQFEGGVQIGTEGSWQAGVDGAKPGIIMMANPKIGDSYRQEFYKGVAEDMAEVLSLNASVAVPYGSFDNCLKTREWTPLEPGVIANKYYAPGIGCILEITTQGGSERVELIDVVKIPK